MPRFACLLLVALAAGCARIEFQGGGGEGTGGMPISGGGGGGDGGTGGDGGEPQGGTPNPCPGVVETCNGIDDDCDGVADEPETFPATACECDWISFDERPYASCPTVGPPEDANCPAGMRIVVLQSMAEHDALLELVLTPMKDGYVGMRQVDGSPERDTGWQWFREGMPPPWFGNGQSEPDDYTSGAFEPVAYENDSENCAGLYNYGDTSNNRGLVDSDCIDAFERVLCEPIADECVMGGKCLLDKGCAGVFDCSLPVGSQCVAEPTVETCDGKDNNCDGEADEDACGCVELVDGSTTYKKCSAAFTPDNTRCGEGFRLAMLGSASEVAFAQAQVALNEVVTVGMYQRTTALMPDSDWLFLDASPVVLPFWGPSQPNDGDMVENDAQNCGTVHDNGVFDSECSEPYGYLCEQL